MCTYITVVVPEGTDEERARELFKRHGLRFDVYKETPPAIRTSICATTCGHCDCGTALGNERAAEMAAEDPAEQIPKLRKKGWSEAKIERWLADKTRRPDRHVERNERELAQWIALIPDVLESEVANKIGVFVHFYNEPTSADVIKRIEQVPLDRLSSELLVTMADDTLYEFVPSRYRR
jgi:hypothetical protein